MTVATSKRRGRGEDSIYWDATKSCYVGAVSLGYSPSGTRIRKRVMARTKTEVREKLKELHQQAENGVRPRRHYTVNDALDDWLETGLDGLAPSTMTGNHDRAARHEHLAASYWTMRDHYQQQQQALTQTMAHREEWDQATASSRRFAPPGHRRRHRTTPPPPRTEDRAASLRRARAP